MFFSVLFPSIAVTTTLVESGAWSSAWIAEFLPVFYIAIGIACLSFAIKWVMGRLQG